MDITSMIWSLVTLLAVEIATTGKGNEWIPFKVALHRSHITRKLSLHIVHIDCPHRTLCDGTSFYCYFGTDC